MRIHPAKTIINYDVCRCAFRGLDYHIATPLGLRHDGVWWSRAYWHLTHTHSIITGNFKINICYFEKDGEEGRERKVSGCLQGSAYTREMVFHIQNLVFCLRDKVPWALHLRAYPHAVRKIYKNLTETDLHSGSFFFGIISKVTQGRLTTSKWRYHEIILFEYLK